MFLLQNSEQFLKALWKQFEGNVKKNSCRKFFIWNSKHQLQLLANGLYLINKRKQKKKTLLMQLLFLSELIVKLLTSPSLDLTS